MKISDWKNLLTRHTVNAADIASVIEEARTLRGTFQRDWFYEEEIRAHTVVPLLRLLGWAPSAMKMEWCDADIVLMTEDFQTMETQAKTNERNKPLVHTVIELKAAHIENLEAAHEQCRGYRAKFPAARRFVTTNGRHWKIQDGDGGIVDLDLFEPSARAAEILWGLSRGMTVAGLNKRAG